MCSHLPAGLAELLDIDGATECDDEDRERVWGQAVVTHHGIQDLQRHLQKSDNTPHMHVAQAAALVHMCPATVCSNTSHAFNSVNQGLKYF